MVGIVPLAAVALIAADKEPGYLPLHAIDLTKVLPPAPQEGDIRYATDRKIFKAMKARIGSPRWDLATSDVDLATPAVMRDFACATGIALSPTTTPATYRLLDTASRDTSNANNDAKDQYRRLRPFWIDKGETCQPKKDLGKSYDYPSGHTTKGWTVGLVLADALPDRATPILTRARAYGESRIVCRVHNFSAVENGRLSATVTMEAVRATPAYQADLAAAKAELAAARASTPAPDAGACAAEAALIGPSVLAGLKD
ncbi:phosphatase PAP2 family protein [Sphingomonas nostoxanthinifaciens]|nr:phosphatase PAP2 family protein [Sphingomonas nostoxanthinifaciens]